jgi:hypothetical protein
MPVRVKAARGAKRVILRGGDFCNYLFIAQSECERVARDMEGWERKVVRHQKACKADSFETALQGFIPPLLPQASMSRFARYKENRPFGPNIELCLAESKFTKPNLVQYSCLTPEKPFLLITQTTLFL